MSNSLKSYVENFLLNPAVKIGADIDGDANEETIANVSKKVAGNEGVNGTIKSISKLRIQNNLDALQTDPHYKGKKTTRKKLSTAATSHDPSLSKYFLLEENEDEEEDTKSDSNGEPISEEEEFEEDEECLDSENDEECLDSENDEEDKEEDLFLKMGEDDEEADSGDEDEESIEGNEEEESMEELENEDQPSGSFRAFSSEDSEQFAKSVAVKNQCSIYDTLFEIRIALQKVLSVSNQLPQHDTYEHYLKVADSDYRQYKSNLSSSRKSLKKLMEEIFSIQDLLFSKNSETTEMLQELGPTSSTNDEEDEVSKKRKLNYFEESLVKRRRVLTPFRDQTLARWYERSKLLGGQAKNKFASFDVAPSQQIANLLSNKTQLIRRTQTLGVSRGNVYKILGKSDPTDSVATEEFDPEIFDDSDFYSRLLEDLLKSKVAASEDMLDVSRRWIAIQKLRKKAKKNVDTKASKGRKIRYEAMTKLQQYLAPCKPSLMEDDATNRLFSSLFGQAVDINKLPE